LDFLFDLFGVGHNLRMTLQTDYEIEISDDSKVTTSEEFPSFQDKPTININGKESSSKPKRRCRFNQK
ncbi:unnamed protein product, partial [Rotaria magnacalcarata]